MLPSADLLFDIDGTIVPNFLGEVPGISRQKVPYLKLHGTGEEIPRHVLDLMRWAHGRSDVQPHWFSARLVDARERTVRELFPNALVWPDTALTPTDRQSHVWWKVQVIAQWLRDPRNVHRRLVALDDDLSDCLRTGELPAELAADTRFLLISPDHCIGLTEEQTDAAVHFIAHGVRPTDSMVVPNTDPNAASYRALT
ncbi:hypothetical protein ACXR2T_07990 [Leucobacter sp. HY1910]